MEQYKKKLKIENAILAVAIVIMAAVMVVGYCRGVNPSYADAHWAEFWSGMYTGMAAAVVGISIVGIIQNCLALKNEKKLKKMYVQENDERTRAIWEKVGGQSYWYVAVGMMLAVVVSGYFNPVVSITCLGCLLYSSLVRAALTIYYKRKL